MKNKFTHGQFVLMALIVLILSSCHKNLKPATVIVVNPKRHYYPVLQGEMMSIAYEMENTSDNPLFIQEIQTTCGCVVPRNQLPIVILPHKTSAVFLAFNTIKNTGYVNHFVYCYGNFQDTTCIELEFDTNVVPRNDYVHDYEQLWQEQARGSESLRDFVDGMPSQKGYYTDTYITPRTNFNEEVQQVIDEHSF